MDVHHPKYLILGLTQPYGLHGETFFSLGNTRGLGKKVEVFTFGECCQQTFQEIHVASDHAILL